MVKIAPAILLRSNLKLQLLFYPKVLSYLFFVNGFAYSQAGFLKTHIFRFQNPFDNKNGLVRL